MKTMSHGFNVVASVAAFFLGTLYVFSDGTSINANVIGASGSDAGLVSIAGIVMIIGAIALFMTSLHEPLKRRIELESMVHETKNTEYFKTRAHDQKDEDYKNLLKEGKR